MREWLTVIIALLILGILLDGVRRMRAHRRDSLKMSRRINSLDMDSEPLEEGLSSSEFPSGGARVAAYRDPDDLENVNLHLRESYVASRQTRGAPNRIPEQVSLNLDASVPMLMDSVVEQTAEKEKTLDRTAEPSLGSLDNLDEEDSNSVPHVFKPSARVDEEPNVVLEKPQLAAEKRAAEKPCEPEVVQTKPEKHRAVPSEAPKKTASAPAAPDEVLIINVMAKRGQMFAGAALLDALVGQGLRFGDMDIFHRHENADGTGKILFSVANIVVPGTFEVGAMEDFETPGVSMFLSLPLGGDSIAAFNLMASAATIMATQLGGELKDENRSVMTRQTIEHARQRVVEYERKRRLAK